MHPLEGSRQEAILPLTPLLTPAFRGAPPGTPLRRVAADASLFASMWGRPGGRRTICAYLPLFPRAPRLLHAAFGRLSGRAQARCSSHVRTVDS